MKENIICSNCGDVIENGGETVNNKIICHDCAEDFCIRCHKCGNLMFSTADYGDSNISLCRSCFEDGYKRCQNCNRLIRNNDSNKYDNRHYCQFCYKEIYSKKEEKKPD